MIRVVSLFLLIFIFSCSRNIGNDVNIINKTLTTLKSVEIGTSEDLETIKVNNIKSGDVHKGFLDMNANQVDGDYYYVITKDNGEIEKRSFGYYSNGYPLEKLITIKVLEDTTIVSFKFD